MRLYEFLTVCGLASLFLGCSATPMLSPEMEFKLTKMNLSNFCDFMIGPCEVPAIQTDEDDWEHEDKVLVSGVTSTVAKLDACNPRDMTVALPKDEDPNVLIWPNCIRARRCGGCCNSETYSCEPVETRPRYVSVFKLVLPYPHAQSFEYGGVKVVEITEHMTCDAQCKVKAFHCTTLQTYEPRTCRCVCRNRVLSSTCRDDQVWDDNECACVCPNKRTTVCPGRSTFDDTLCRCTVNSVVSGDIDLSKQELVDLLRAFNYALIDTDKGYIISLGDEHVPGEGNNTGEDRGQIGLESTSSTTPTTTESTTTTTTTTTPTTTTTSTTTTTTPPPPTTPTTTLKPCPPCFSNWIPTRLSNGKCGCLPNFGRKFNG